MPEWPALNFSEWETTCDTVHMWTQIVGKTRMALAPPVNHWWHAALYVTPVGLTTSAIPYDDREFDVEFDFVAHRLTIRTSDGRIQTLSLYERSVADFYAEYMAALQALGISVRINRTPAEFDDPTPHDEDRHHAQYDEDHVEKFHRVLMHADRALKKFRSPFIGKCSPVHFFWGSFDLAVTRFSGRRAPERPDADSITREGYSHEVSSAGFWPGDRKFKNAAFYSYTAPAPPGIEKESYWDPQMNMFLLKYDDVRSVKEPHAALLDFCRKTYESGARLANWDRAALER
jgi:hypothetical protein